MEAVTMEMIVIVVGELYEIREMKDEICRCLW